MSHIKLVTFCFLCFVAVASADEFTIGSYNCGGLSDHYDYLRAANMQKVMQQRYMAEPENMALNDKIQKLALKILFSPHKQEREEAIKFWDQHQYQRHFERLTAPPSELESPNTLWNEKVNHTITSYKERPVVLSDEEVKRMLADHLEDLSQGDSERASLTEVRALMARRIFEHHLKFDIICLQEADYLDSSLFPEHYRVELVDSSHSKNGIAWNINRFELIETIGDIAGRAFALKLLERATGKTVAIVSGHLTGCNPYRVETDSKTGVVDSAKGDQELQAIIEVLEGCQADYMVIGMDSNVTALHPRLKILKEAGYRLDYENYLEPTCTNPYQVLDTRIDWIAVKSNEASIVNIPVLGVGLNNLQTNMSDHRPIASKIAEIWR